MSSRWRVNRVTGEREQIPDEATFWFHENGKAKIGNMVGVAVVTLLLLVLIGTGMGAGCGAYNRWQARQDAANEVTITHTHIEKAHEEAAVQHAEIEATEAAAQKRYQESIGLKRAQDEIRKTLTPLYVQHEYVEALKEVAHSPSNTIEFIPVGANGIPIVEPTGAGNALTNP